MLTREKVLEAVRTGRESGCLDRRDYNRLIEFFPVSDWAAFGFAPKGDDTLPIIREWDEATIRDQLASDLAFGFEKGLNQRGISAGLMYAVVKMWLWVLEDPLQDLTAYAQYGLPLFRAVAVKYGLPNPIGNDAGDEAKYASH